MAGGGEGWRTAGGGARRKERSSCLGQRSSKRRTRTRGGRMKNRLQSPTHLPFAALKAFPCCCHRRCPLRLSLLCYQLKAKREREREVHFVSRRRETKKHNKGEIDIAALSGSSSSFFLSQVLCVCISRRWFSSYLEEPPPLLFGHYQQP